MNIDLNPPLNTLIPLVDWVKKILLGVGSNPRLGDSVTLTVIVVHMITDQGEVARPDRPGVLTSIMLVVNLVFLPFI